MDHAAGAGGNSSALRPDAGRLRLELVALRPAQTESPWVAGTRRRSPSLAADREGTARGRLVPALPPPTLRPARRQPIPPPPRRTTSTPTQPTRSRLLQGRPRHRRNRRNPPSRLSQNQTLAP